MPSKNGAVAPERWKKNQNVQLTTSGSSVNVMAAQANSTPGAVLNIRVKAGGTYKLMMSLESNCRVIICLLESKGKTVLAECRGELGNRTTLVVDFHAQVDGQQRIGVLFPSNSSAPSGDPLERWFEISSAVLTESVSKAGAVASMATFPARSDRLNTAVISLRGQVDHLFVHLNGFDDVPDFLRQPWISVTRSQQLGDLMDTGKFVGLRSLDEDTIAFTVDDDIIYPADYVERMVDTLRKYDNRVVVGVHGTAYPRFPRSFFDRLTAHYKQNLAVDLPVSCLGTGTTAFRIGTFRPDVSNFPIHGMADLYFAGLAKRSGVPLIAIQRQKDWLSDVVAPKEEVEDHSLYKQTRLDSSPHLGALREQGPWGYEEIIKTLRGRWEHFEESPLGSAAREFLDFMLWIEHGCRTARPEIALTPEILGISSTLRLRGLLREAVRNCTAS